MTDLSGQKIGNLFVMERDKGYKGNNIRYIVKCKCGALFSAFSFHLVVFTVTCCQSCRKLKTKQKQMDFRAEKRILGRDYFCEETKYVLMDTGKTKILKGTMGRYLFFDLRKARIAARNIIDRATVVPLLEAEAIERTL